MPTLIAEGVPVEYFETLCRERAVHRQESVRVNRNVVTANKSFIVSLGEFLGTVQGRYTLLLFQFLMTATVGAVFFKANAREGDMTWVDSFYFAVVTSCAVGYGDITPQSVSGKIFAIPYMLCSTVIAAKLIVEFINLYVNDTVGERITKQILDSVTYVYRADINSNGVVTETDYVMFKLHQLQKINRTIENELVKRFKVLDLGGEGFLDVGIDIPSAAQLRSLEELNLLGRDSTEEALKRWRQMRPAPEVFSQTLMRHVSIADCHEFVWSPVLWARAKREIAQTFFVFIAFYFLVGGFMCQREGLGFLDSVYLFAQTVTMVGLGDLSPSEQASRAAGILLIPLGIVIVLLGISYLTAAGLSRPVSSAAEWYHEAEAEGGEKNSDWFLKLKQWFRDTDLGQVTLVFIKFVAVILSGALFFYYSGSFEDIDTVVDAIFFATLIACTVGYGHKIWPVEKSGKVFCIFYFFFSSFVVGKLLREFSVIYSNMGPNDEMIMDSIMLVHLADLEMNGKITQAGWILFKLRQMQRVDDKLLIRIVQRFHELDDNFTGTLEIGVDIPSCDQVQQMKDEVSHTHPSEGLIEQGEEVAELWSKIRPRFQKDRVRFQGQGAKKVKLVKLMESHDFEWSSRLWNEQANDTIKTASLALVAFFVWSTLSMWVVETEKVTAVDAMYCSMATLATVGYGDFAPTRQLNRGMAIITMPFGLVIIGVLVSYVETKANSRRPPISLDPRAGSFSLEDEKTDGTEPENTMPPIVKFAQTRQGFHSILVHEGGLRDYDHTASDNLEPRYLPARGEAKWSSRSQPHNTGL
mmetsp:Transcript_59988/g.120395  ORF Transcript_59988/g.120395 Transcript_59988/m.120395 type:complete len:809 (-) Transcript_59988:91-2517(-)